jgi:outer membrane lipoprotein SlyB
MKEVHFMKTKRLIMLLMAAVFALGLVSPSFSAQETKGTVAKIEGNQLTIQDDMGKEVTIKVADPKTIRDLKVGDKVVVTQVGNSVKVTKEGG